MSKRCCTCDELKDYSEFHKRSDSEDGYRSDCKDCRKNKRTIDYSAEEIRCKGCDRKLPKTEEFFYTYKKSPWGFRPRCRSCMRRKSMNNHYNVRYNLSLEDVENIKVSKDNQCEICSNDVERLVVDHDHSTGDFRGILCDRCNTGLGNFKDSPQLLINAIGYLTNL